MKKTSSPSNVKRASLVDQVYEKLKWQILSMELLPGSDLNELDLCKKLKFGRGPVHHALQRLSHDRLVRIRPRKGVVVRALSPRDIEELIEARLPLELAIVRLAAERAEKVEAVSLKKRLLEGRKLIVRRDREGLMKLDHDFHIGLAALTGNAVFEDLIARLHQQSSILWFLQVSDEKTYAAVQKEHEAILDCVIAGDGKGASAAMMQHLNAFRMSPPKAKAM